MNAVEINSPGVQDVRQGITTNTEVCEDYPTMKPLSQYGKVSKELKKLGEDCVEFKERGHAGSQIVQDAQPISQIYNLPGSSLSSSCKCRTAIIKFYRCGVCSGAYKTVCKLHEHFEYIHSETEVYVFDKLTKTAFPRYRSVCKHTQTDTELLHIKKREAEFVYADNKDTQVRHDDNKVTVFMHGKYRNPELLHREDGNTELLHREDGSTELLNCENRNPELLHREDRNTELLHRVDGSTELLNCENRNPELLHREDRNTELLHRVDGSTELLHREDRNTELLHRVDGSTELLHREDRNTELLHRVDGSTELLHRENRNTELLHLENRNSNLMQHENENTKMLVRGNKKRKLLHVKNKNTEIQHRENRALKMRILIKGDMIEIVNDELVEADIDLERGFSDDVDSAADAYRNDPPSEINAGTDHPPQSVSVQTLCETTEPGPSRYTDSDIQDSSVCLYVDVRKSKIEKHNKLKSWTGKRYRKAKRKIWNRKKGGKANAEKMKLVAEEKGLLCKICEKAFPSNFAFERHNRRLHWIKCNDCGEKLDPDQMKHHKNALHFYRCHYCRETFADIDVRRSHLKTHPPLFVCTYEKCGRKFRTKTFLDRHEKKHTLENEIQKMCACHLCGKIMCTKSLKQHSCMQSRKRSFKCDLCQKEFSLKNTLKTHLMTHTNTQEKPHVCLCGKAFSTRSNLNIHSRVHSGDKPYICEFCGTQLSTLSGLNKHKLTHEQDKPFMCQCGKAFSNTWNLKAHSRQHSGEKPYMCQVCGAQFTHNVSRKNHMKKHTGVSDS